GHRGTPAQMTRVKKSSRAVIGTNPRKFGNLWNHSAHSGLKGGAPNFGIIPVPGLENHGGTTRATALEIHLAPIADLDQTGKITGSGDWGATLRCNLWR